MSSWFKDRRLEFVAATFRQFGQVRRCDVVREFGVTTQVASADIARFMDSHPRPVRYDVSAKMYVLVEDPLP